MLAFRSQSVLRRPPGPCAHVFTSTQLRSMCSPGESAFVKLVDLRSNDNEQPGDDFLPIVPNVDDSQRGCNPTNKIHTSHASKGGS